MTTLLNHLEANADSPTLSLAYASVGDDGMPEVSRFIRDNVFVRYLDLRGNNIGAKGAAALAGGLKLNRSLRSLNLKWNQIGKENTGIEVLCDTLKTNITVSHLDLRNNRIGNIGAKYVGEMLRDNSTITHLDLSWNDLGVEGGLALLDGLKHNSSVIDCQLSGSKVGEETLHDVAFLLRRNRAANAYKSTNNPGAPSAPTKAEIMGSAGATSPRKDAGATMQSPRSFVTTSGSAETDVMGKTTRAMKKDENNLMLRLMMREREQVLPEDRLFYRETAEHIDKIALEVAKHKQGRIDAEERERLSTSGFIDREMRYSKEIRNLEEGLQQCVADKEHLQKEISLMTAELKRLSDDHAASIRESVAIQEQSHSQEESLRKELRDIMTEKRSLQDQLAIGRKDMEMIEQENNRLRAHVRGFQRDVNEILVA